jgi:hypothetical protein
MGLSASPHCALGHRLLQGSPHRPGHENRGSDAGSVPDVDAPCGKPHPAGVRVTGDFAFRDGNPAARVRERNAHGVAPVVADEDTVFERDAYLHSIRPARVDSHTESNPDVHRHRHADTHPNCDVHGDSDTDFHSDPDRDGVANGHRAASSHPDADGHGYAAAHEHVVADGYADADSDPNRYTDAGADRRTHGHGDPVSRRTVSSRTVGPKRFCWRCP